MNTNLSQEHQTLLFLLLQQQLMQNMMPTQPQNNTTNQHDLLLKYLILNQLNMQQQNPIPNNISPSNLTGNIENSQNMLINLLIQQQLLNQTQQEQQTTQNFSINNIQSSNNFFQNLIPQTILINSSVNNLYNKQQDKNQYHIDNLSNMNLNQKNRVNFQVRPKSQEIQNSKQDNQKQNWVDQNSKKDSFTQHIQSKFSVQNQFSKPNQKYVDTKNNQHKLDSSQIKIQNTNINSQTSGPSLNISAIQQEENQYSNLSFISPFEDKSNQQTRFPADKFEESSINNNNDEMINTNLSNVTLKFNITKNNIQSSSEQYDNTKNSQTDKNTQDLKITTSGSSLNYSKSMSILQGIQFTNQIEVNNNDLFSKDHPKSEIKGLVFRSIEGREIQPLKKTFFKIKNNSLNKLITHQDETKQTIQKQYLPKKQGLNQQQPFFPIKLHKKQSFQQFQEQIKSKQTAFISHKINQQNVIQSASKINSKKQIQLPLSIPKCSQLRIQTEINSPKLGSTSNSHQFTNINKSKPNLQINLTPSSQQMCKTLRVSTVQCLSQANSQSLSQYLHKIKPKIQSETNTSSPKIAKQFSIKNFFTKKSSPKFNQSSTQKLQIQQSQQNQSLQQQQQLKIIELPIQKTKDIPNTDYENQKQQLQPKQINHKRTNSVRSQLQEFEKAEYKYNIDQSHNRQISTPNTFSTQNYLSQIQQELKLFSNICKINGQQQSNTKKNYFSNLISVIQTQTQNQENDQTDLLYPSAKTKHLQSKKKILKIQKSNYLQRLRTKIIYKKHRKQIKSTKLIHQKFSVTIFPRFNTKLLYQNFIRSKLDAKKK